MIALSAPHGIGLSTPDRVLVSAGKDVSVDVGQDKTDATVMGVNYTNDYIHFRLISPSGESFGIGGDAKPFSKGGTGGWSCCAMVPSVGQTVRVELSVGGFNDAADQHKTYSRDVVVVGTMPKPEYKLQSYLIVRFFPRHEVEAEFIAGDDPLGMRNPRVDQLLLGQRVMRHLGE